MRQDTADPDSTVQQRRATIPVVLSAWTRPSYLCLGSKPVAEGIHTLQEFMFQTKGMVYLLAIAYLIAFTWFWKFISNTKKNRD